MVKDSLRVVTRSLFTNIHEQHKTPAGLSLQSPTMPTMQRVRHPSDNIFAPASDYGGVVPDHLVNPASKDPWKKKKDQTSRAMRQMSDAEFERTVYEGIGLNEVGDAEREAYKQVLMSSDDWSECDKMSMSFSLH